MVHDGLWDIINDFHMGIANEIAAEKYNVTREDQDRYAAMSYARTMESIKSGRFKDEIVPVEITKPKIGTVIFDTDECPEGNQLRGLGQDEAGFQEGTAPPLRETPSVISDGAAACVVMSREKAEQFGLRNHGHHRRPGVCGRRCQVHSRNPP